jgi:hypothetical protein
MSVQVEEQVMWRLVCGSGTCSCRWLSLWAIDLMVTSFVGEQRVGDWIETYHIVLIQTFTPIR